MTAIAVPRAWITSMVPDAPDPLVDRTLLEVARDFCKETRAWRSTITESVVASVLTVAVTPPADAELTDIVKATLDTNSIRKVTDEQAETEDPEWRTRPGVPWAIMLDDTLDQVALVPLPQSASTALVIRAAWKPTLTAVTLDAKLLSDHSEALIQGTLAKLFMIPEAPWENSNKGTFYAGSYNLSMLRAKDAVSDGGMKGVARKVKYGGL